MRVDRLDVQPERRGGYVSWADRRGASEVRFLGRGPHEDRHQALAATEPQAPAVAWARQVHSATVLPAVPGFCGEGDALTGVAEGLALSIITADCVPVLVASPDGLVAIHAGWRGLVAGAIPRALATLPPGTPRIAWIGPTIGPCCYEVGTEVAEQVAATSRPDVAVPGARGRPHLDLVAAALEQLSRGGVEEARVLPLCTACHPELLWSYRREGARAGRNMSFLWRTPGEAG